MSIARTNELYDTHVDNGHHNGQRHTKRHRRHHHKHRNLNGDLAALSSGRFSGWSASVTGNNMLFIESDEERPGLKGDGDRNDVPLHWPIKKEAIMEGDLVLGGLMMVHSREDTIMCGPIMPQGGIQALEVMLYTLDRINRDGLLPNITIGAHILDDCDRDSYGLEMAVDFIKGKLCACLQSIL